MISDEEEEDEAVVFRRIALNRGYRHPIISPNNHLQTDVYEQEENNIHQQLADKEQYLQLAAEAGNHLLQKNQHLTNHFEKLQEEYLKKIESLQQDRYHLRKALEDQGAKHESYMHDLRQEVNTLGGQLQVIQKSSRAVEKSTESTYENLSGQNNSLLQELDKVKDYNQQLTQQVEMLYSRIDEQDDVVEKVRHRAILNDELKFNEAVASEEDSCSLSQIDAGEVQGLRETVRQLIDQKDFLEESLSGLLKEKYNDKQQQGVEGEVSSKVSSLEGDVSNLRQQVIMFQEELHHARKRNENLKEQMEEYVLMQTSQQLNSSLLNELEMSVPEADIPEADMNFYGTSTPVNGDREENDAIPSDTNEVKTELHSVYCKLHQLKNELANEVDVQVALDCITTDDVSKLVDVVIKLIHVRIRGSGQIGNEGSIHQHVLANSSENVPTTPSVPSGEELQILEQQVNELNLCLNIKRSELENLKKQLLSSQKGEGESNNKVQELSVTMNCQARELQALHKQVELLLSDETLDTKLKKAIQAGDEALRSENEIKAKYETAQNDMQKLNKQLISAVQQKHELSEQLEQWQCDMALLIDQRVNKRMISEKKNARKHSSTLSPSHKQSFAAKLFTLKSSK